MEPDSVHELTAAYALDALDPREEGEYEEHLSRCRRCQEELASLSEAATALAYAPAAPAPSTSLRGRILDQARSERERVVPLRPRWALPTAVSLAAAAACVAVGLGLWASSLSDSLASERSAREGQERSLALVADTGAARLPLSGDHGLLVVSRSGEAVLVVSGLERAPSGKMYEAWVARGGKPIPAGSFRAERKVSFVPLARPVGKGTVVLLTLEPEGPVTAPSGRILSRART